MPVQLHGVSGRGLAVSRCSSLDARPVTQLRAAALAPLFTICLAHNLTAPLPLFEEWWVLPSELFPPRDGGSAASDSLPPSSTLHLAEPVPSSLNFHLGQRMGHRGPQFPHSSLGQGSPPLGSSQLGERIQALSPTD